MSGNTFPFNSEAQLLGESTGTKIAVNKSLSKQYTSNNKIIDPREDVQIHGRKPRINSQQKEVKSLNRYRGISSSFYEQRHQLSLSSLSKDDKLKCEVGRLDTFFEYAPCSSTNYSPLAEAGFCCDSDKTIRCTSCKAICPGWFLEKGYCTSTLRCLNPECKGITSENIPLTSHEATTVDTLQQQEQHQEQQHEHSSLRPRRPQHKTTEANKEKDTPSSCKRQKESDVIWKPSILSQKSDEWTELIQKNHKLQEEIGNQQKLLQQQEDKIIELEAQLGKYSKRLEEDLEMKKKQDIAEQYCQLESNTDLYFQHFIELCKEIRGLKDRIKNLELDHKRELQDNLEKVKILLQNLKDREKELEDTRKNKERLERDFTDYRSKKKQKQINLTLELKKVKKKCEDFEKQLQCKEKKCEDFEKQLQCKEKKCEDFEKQLQCKEKKCEDFEKQLQCKEKKCEDFEKQLQCKEKKCEDFEKQLQCKEKKCEDFEKQLQCKEKKCEDFEKQLQCKVCLENIVNIVFLPCGHVVCCEQCALHLYNSNARCPVCRNAIHWGYTGKIFLG